MRPRRKGFTVDQRVLDSSHVDIPWFFAGSMHTVLPGQLTDFFFYSVLPARLLTQRAVLIDMNDKFEEQHHC
jgi:hypothetical protein